MDLVELAESYVAKSQVVRGVYTPITQTFGDMRFADDGVRAALRARLKGTPVYHGGSKRRVRRMVQGKEVNTGNKHGKFTTDAVFTSPDKDTARLYATSGRTRDSFRSAAGRVQASRPSGTRSDGRVAALNMKGVWPKAVSADGNEIAYNPADVKGRITAVQGASRARLTGRRATRLREEEDRSIADARRWADRNKEAVEAVRQGRASPANMDADIRMDLAGDLTSAEQAAVNRRRFLRG